MKEVYLVTGNENKLREFREILGIDIEMIDLDLDEIQTIDVESVIKHKLIQAYNLTKKNILVEDTGLHFSAWDGLPGALIKWFLKSVHNEGLLVMLKDFQDRSASAVTAVGFYDGKEILIKKGVTEGTISPECRGDMGFGWDKIFIPAGHKRTFAEMLPEEKNKISMRKTALDKIRPCLF